MPIGVRADEDVVADVGKSSSHVELPSIEEEVGTALQLATRLDEDLGNRAAAGEFDGGMAADIELESIGLDVGGLGEEKVAAISFSRQQDVDSVDDSWLESNSHCGVVRGAGGLPADPVPGCIPVGIDAALGRKEVLSAKVEAGVAGADRGCNGEEKLFLAVTVPSLC